MYNKRCYVGCFVFAVVDHSVDLIRTWKTIIPLLTALKCRVKMCDHRFCDLENIPVANKRLKTNQKVNAVVVASKEKPPDIFKLNIVCFHEIFEWLSLYELVNVGQTCKHLQHMAGVYFQITYGMTKTIPHYYYYDYYENDYAKEMQKTDVFGRYVEKMDVSLNRQRIYSYIATKCKSLRQIRFVHFLPEKRLLGIKDNLEPVEVVDLHDCFIHDEFYDHFLKYCPRVKTISVKRSAKPWDESVIIGSGNEWMHRTYPSLQQIELTAVNELKMNELKAFFNANPNVQTFSTDSSTLCANRYCLLSSGIKLDRLAIDIASDSVAESVIDLLNELYERQFFKRLYVYASAVSQHHLNKMVSLPFSISIRMLYGLFGKIDTPLRYLKIMGFYENPRVIGMDVASIPMKFPNLNQIFFHQAHVDDVRHLIRHSVELTTIVVRSLFGQNFIDLFPLIRERAKLFGARKVTIHLDSNLILMAKWATNTLDSDLVAFKHFKTFEWDDLNARTRTYHCEHYY